MEEEAGRQDRGGYRSGATIIQPHRKEIFFCTRFSKNAYLIDMNILWLQFIDSRSKVLVIVFYLCDQNALECLNLL